MDEPHRCNAGEEKPDTREYTLYDSTFINFKNWYN